MKRASEGLARLMKDLESLNLEIESGLAEEAENILKEAAYSRGYSEGSVESSIDSHGSSVTVGTPLFYVELGRGPITAREGGFLSFTIDNERFFRKSVGPARPNPFIEVALDNGEERLQKRCEAIITKFIKGD